MVGEGFESGMGVKEGRQYVDETYLRRGCWALRKKISDSILDSQTANSDDQLDSLEYVQNLLKKHYANVDTTEVSIATLPAFFQPWDPMV